MKNEQIMTSDKDKVAESEVKTAKIENLFESEVVDTAYTCHENRRGGR